MIKSWDSRTIAMLGALVGFLVSIGAIIANRIFAPDTGSISIFPVIGYIVGCAALLGAVSVVRNRFMFRSDS